MNRHDCDAENKLIAALPPVRSEADYLEAFEKIPFINENDRLSPAKERVLMVSQLGDYRIGREFGYVVDWRIAEALRKGYRLSAERDTRKSFPDVYYRKIEGDTTAFVLIGPSGVGKTTVLNESLSYYPQVIEHQVKDGRMEQVVYLKVECPPGGSVKTFYDYIMDEFEKVLDYEIKDKEKFKTADQKERLIKHLAIRWNLGVLIIDEIQNLLVDKNHNLMNQFLTLSNELKVPIIYVGTDRILEYFKTSEFFMKRRLGVEIHAKAYKKDMLWNSFLEDVWNYQWMKEFVPLTDELNEIFYSETGGIINRVIELFGAAQREAIMTGKDTKERFTPAFIEYISKKFFSMSRESLKNLTTPQIALFKIPEVDLKQTVINDESMKPFNSVAKEMELSKKYLMSTERIENKASKDSLKTRTLTNVTEVMSLLPYSFTAAEIKRAVEKILKQENVMDKDEGIIQKEVIAALLSGKQEKKKKKAEQKVILSEDDFPKFKGVI